MKNKYVCRECGSEMRNTAQLGTVVERHITGFWPEFGVKTLKVPARGLGKWICLRNSSHRAAKVKRTA